MTSLNNKEEISKLLEENRESAAELIGHLSHLLQTTQKLQATFKDNPKYDGYVKNAEAKKGLPIVTQFINDSNNKLSSVGKQFLTREIGSPSRFRP